MSPPNLRNVTTITAKVVTLAITTSDVAALTNPAGSGKVFKVLGMRIANIHGSETAWWTGYVADASAGLTAYLAATVDVAIKTSVSPITRETYIYLEEGDAIKLSAQSNSHLTVLISYEEISST